MPTTNLTFHIEPQISSILARNPNLLKPSWDLNRVSDIVDSSSYRHIVDRESSPFITLLMNSDGILLKKISYSVWITCFAINELPADVRFDPKNIIVAMVSHSSAKAKLKRDEMQILLDGLVDQLVILEREGVIINEDNIHDNDVQISGENKEKKYKVYLFRGVCDKPATAMLTNMIECTGYYGFFDLIAGVDFPSGQGHVRSYVFLPEEQSTERTNQTYDFVIKALTKVSLKGTLNATNPNSKRQQVTDNFLGHKGPCALRRLKYFDVCQGFLVDPLHSLYAGCFKRFVCIELNDKYVQQNVTTVFNTIRYPSTSYRIPRSLSYFNDYKGNEYRIALLFGYRSFKNFIPDKNYQLLKILAFAAHIGEARFVTSDMVDDMNTLLDEFDLRLPDVYSCKEMVGVVHAVSHLAQCVAKAGPMSNWNTFSFESVVGFVKCIVKLMINNDILFMIQQVSITLYAEELIIGDQKFQCPNVMIGHVKTPSVYHIIRTSNVIEKLAFQREHLQPKSRNTSYLFFRYPNFRTST
ncbi:unnamed protein product [Rotaria sordida]|uniref:Uncharacterized protein n=1 Tax=Rotaria sordida TaxID=392033 RepID=A0A815PFU0_9BILA|nr:unnamed protein product [Rotaria sordida]CAF1638315.1 unnamed protein product [Rotaria sordida]